MKRLPEPVASGKVLLSKQYSGGSAFLVELAPGMIAVIAYRGSGDPAYSRAYVCSESNKKEVLLDAKRQFKYVKECLMQRKYRLLEDLE